MSALYLKGLNGIRAIAAIAVLISHICQVFGSTGLDLAGFGVTIFFALSGFLITLLLIKEKEKTATISVRKFYIRRILRIWPLYFLYFLLAVSITTLLFEENYTLSQLIYYIFFVPNIPFVLGGAIGTLAHFWSLGVEEQFYFFWPFFTNKIFSRFLIFNILFIGIFLLLKLFINRYYGGYSIPYTIIYTCRFDCMAIGGIGAYLYHNNFKLIRLFKHIITQVIAWGTIALLAFNNFHVFSIIDHELIAIVTVILIINQVANPKSIINLENKLCNYLGKMSFGIYVYHPLIISLLLYILKKQGYSITSVVDIISFACLIIGLSIITAHISYNCFEVRFLNFKQKYAVVKSSNTAILSNTIVSMSNETSISKSN